MPQPSKPIAPTEIELCGQRVWVDPAGLLYWPDEELAAVADLHLEKGSSYARRGVFLPPYDTRETLTRLDAALTRISPKRVLALGDTFHDDEAITRLTDASCTQIKSLTHAYDWLWITGNHDPTPPSGLGGQAAREIKIGPFKFTHEPDGGLGTVAGHLHPCASIRSHGRRVRRRCFASDGERMILPSFGAFTGGLCVLDVAYASVLTTPFDAILLGERAYRIAHTKLVPDRAA